MTRRRPKSPVSGLMLSATFALAAVLLSAPDRAAAHGADGAMDVQSSAQTGPNTLRLELSIPYPDGDLADNATVTVTLSGPGGLVIPDVPVPRTATGYAADLAVTKPGTWRVVVRSINPAAEATIDVDIIDRGSRRPTDAQAPTVASKPGRGSRLVPLITAAAVLALGCGLWIRRRNQDRGVSRGR